MGDVCYLLFAICYMNKINIEQEERSRLTREAMLDVKAGYVVDHQAVQDWVDSLETDNPLPALVLP